MFLLDTNACVRILNDSSKRLVARFRRESPATIRLCSVVKAELLFGARKSRRVAETSPASMRSSSPSSVSASTTPVPTKYGLLRADLERAGTPIGANDLMIAAIARQHDLTVVTSGSGEFRRVSRLRVEDWT